MHLPDSVIPSAGRHQLLCDFTCVLPEPLSDDLTRVLATARRDCWHNCWLRWTDPGGGDKEIKLAASLWPRPTSPFAKTPQQTQNYTKRNERPIQPNWDLPENAVNKYVCQISILSYFDLIVPEKKTYVPLCAITLSDMFDYKTTGMREALPCSSQEEVSAGTRPLCAEPFWW